MLDALADPQASALTEATEPGQVLGQQPARPASAASTQTGTQGGGRGGGSGGRPRAVTVTVTAGRLLRAAGG
jgi:hypothetical protein